MAHIVFVTSGMAGMLHGSLALVHQLQQAGHRITYTSPKDRSGVVSAQDVKFVKLDDWLLPQDDPELSRWQKFRLLRERQQRALKTMGAGDFAQVIRELEPDLVLIEIEMSPHIMAGQKAGLPLVLLCSFLSIWKRPNLPPINVKIVPGKGWRGHKLGIAWQWLTNGYRSWKKSWEKRWKMTGLDKRSIWNQYAREIGFRAREQYGFSQWHIPFNPGELPIVCLNSVILDFPHVPHPSMHYTGPMVFSNRNDNISTDNCKMLDQLYRKRDSMGQTLIYCGCSTHDKGNLGWLQRVIAAVAVEPNWVMVVGLGDQLKSEQLGALPGNVHVLDWAPQIEVLAHADCAIINAGINSINECIYSVVPMLVFSYGRHDQNGNATRVVYHNLGITGDQEKDTEAQIHKKIQTLLADESYITKLREMRLEMGRQKKQGSSVIEALLNDTETITG